MYRNLDPVRIVETAVTLQQRIDERFQGSGLSRVGAEVMAVSRDAAHTADWLARPNRPLRGLAAAGITLVTVVVASAVMGVREDWRFSTSWAEALQGLEAVINEMVFVGLAVFFFWTLETRLKRRRALRALRELRSLAHIIDMHQLTKDPERRSGALDTASSPARTLSPFELARYLDYCTELLAILSKLAALYVQAFDDPVTLAAVDEIEALTNGLSRKIWQKIMILDRITAAPAG